MSHPVFQTIDTKLGVPGIARLLAERLSRSELNSLFLETFDQITAQIQPAALLTLYQQNRLVKPSSSDVIGLLEKELATLKVLRGLHFEPLELSPVSQLGSCSVVATVDQKKIVSALRGSEVVADATNAIALHIAEQKKNRALPAGSAKYCTVHRHIRTQPVSGKGMTAHFKIGCLVSSGKDVGDFMFEKTNLADQFRALHALMISVFGIDKIRFKLQRRTGDFYRDDFLEIIFSYCRKELPDIKIEMENPLRHNNYYQGVQFKMIIGINKQEIEIADGGFVDWTQQLLGNKKERLLISGFGLELLQRFQAGKE